jgi:hypothetical protein
MTIKGQQQLSSSEVANNVSRYSDRPINPVTTSSQRSHDREASIILALGLSFLAWALGILPMFALDAYTAAGITAVWFGFSLGAALVAVGR